MKRPDFIVRGESLAKHSTLGVGGSADFFAEISDENQLLESWEFSRNKELNVFAFGIGSNLLFSDLGFRGLILKIKLKKMIQDIEEDFWVESGVLVGNVVRLSEMVGFSGFENFAGLPGTVGGAIYCNAGCFNSEFGNKVEALKIFDGENIREINVGKINQPFSYRESFLKNKNWVILAAKLKIKQEKPEVVKEKIKDILQRRRKSQPRSRSAGCIFKNPQLSRHGQRISAGKLIESSNLKGFKIGRAKVSKKHGNFFINLGGATARDFINLIETVKTGVRKEFAVNLQEEIIKVGKF